MSTRIFTARCWLLALCLLLPANHGLRADFVTQIVAFGDSLTDTGNIFNLFGGFYPGPPNFQGRFSNGPLYVERLAERLGVGAPTPSRTGGTNYAYGGAQTGTGNFNIGTQVDSYLATSPTVEAGQLFVIYGGANDFLGGNQNDASVPINNLSSSITALSIHGATQFLVPNLPPLGVTPDYRGTADETRLNDLSVAFNSGLEAELSRLESSLGIHVSRLDTYGLFQDVLGNPSAYGLTNVTDAAYNETTESVVANPDEYLFWDTLHPTATAHRLLGDRAYASVPEPGGTVLLVLGLAWLVTVPRFERSQRLA